MKKKIIVLCTLAIILVSCSSKEEHVEKKSAKQIFNKMVEVMKKNDSFKADIEANSQLPNKEMSRNVYVAQYNNFSDPDLRVGKKDVESDLDSGGNTEMYFSAEKVVVVNQWLKKHFPIEMSDILFHEDLEFLNVNSDIVETLKLADDNQYNLKVTLKFVDKIKKQDYFGINTIGDVCTEVTKAELKIKINKNYTIKECKYEYEMDTEYGKATSNGVVIFNNYAPQKINIPD